MDFKLKFPLYIRFSDFDSLGHVNNAMMLTYFEEARIQYFANVITGDRTDWSENGIILAKAVIDFRKPIDHYYHHFIYIRCSRLGTKSFDFSYKIVSEENNTEQVMAEGTTVMVCYDYASHQTIEIPQDWREKVETFEGS